MKIRAMGERGNEGNSKLNTHSQLASHSRSQTVILQLERVGMWLANIFRDVCFLDFVGIHENKRPWVNFTNPPELTGFPCNPYIFPTAPLNFGYLTKASKLLVFSIDHSYKSLIFTHI